MDGGMAEGPKSVAGADHLRAGQRLHQAEHEATAGLNVAAGEDVRWLPRRRVSDLA